MTDIQFDLGFSSRTVASYPLSRRIAIIKSAEALGFDRLWHSNEKFGRDMVANMTLSATHTERIGIGAAVTDPYSVHPALTAAAMATVDDISSGRVIVGMGAGGSGFPAMGIQRERPVAAMRDAIAIMRGMWSGKPAVVEGEVASVRNGVLGFSARSDIRIVIATRGPAVFRLAGRVADGAMIATMATPQGVGIAWDFVKQGARQAGRDPEEIEIISRVDTCVDHDRDSARAGVKQMIAFLFVEQLPQPRLRHPVGHGGPGRAGGHDRQARLRAHVQGRPTGARGVRGRLRLGRHAGGSRQQDQPHRRNGHSPLRHLGPHPARGRHRVGHPAHRGGSDAAGAGGRAGLTRVSYPAFHTRRTHFSVLSVSTQPKVIGVSTTFRIHIWSHSMHQT